MLIGTRKKYKTEKEHKARRRSIHFGREISIPFFPKLYFFGASRLKRYKSVYF